MTFKRLLTVGLMALFCAGTATAASQLNSVQVTPTATAATVNLRTTGSYAHKEYRPDEHLMLIDLTGVTAASAVDHAAAVTSSALRGYKLSTYTSASGSEVTRIELALGDGVSVSVNDVSDGLKIQLNTGGSSTSASPAPLASVPAPTRPAPVTSAAALPKPALAETSHPAPVRLATVANPTLAPAASPTSTTAPKNVANDLAKKNVPDSTAKSAVTPSAPVVLSAVSATHPAQPRAAVAALPATIRNVSVHPGQGTLDIVVDGPSSAHSFLLTNPDRLVVDFSNAELKPSVKNVAVHTKDVLQVRVGRFQSEPPVIRVVIDLSGPRAFDVVPSDNQVIVRVKTGNLALSSSPLKAAPTPALASVVAPDVAGRTSSASNSSQSVHSALATAALPLPAEPRVATSDANSTSRLREQQGSEPKTPTPAPKAIAPKATEAKAAEPKTSPIAATVIAAPVPAAATVAANPAAKPLPQLASPASETAHPKPAAPEPSAAIIAVAKPVATTPSRPRDPQTVEPKAAAVEPKAPVSISVAPPAVATVSAPKAVPPPVEMARLSPPAPEPSPSIVAVAQPTVIAPPQLRDQQTSELKPAPVEPAAAPKAAAPIATPAVVGPVAPKVAAPPAEIARLTPPAPDQPTASQAPASPASKYTGEPISVNLKDVDLKDFFRLIHEISGLNIVLDPSVRGSVTLVLDDVPWDQALDIVLKNNSLDRELQGNVLRIAATDTLRKEAVDRRAQSEAVALAVDRQTITRFLSYAKATLIVPTVKKFLTARGDVISDERTNALIISDIPSVLPNLDRLISQLDRKSQEVEIEVRVVSATRSFSRDLGVQLGFNWGNGVSTIGGGNPNGSVLSPITTPSGITSTVPLFSNLPATGSTTGFSFSNITATYGIDAILTAAETHNLAKVLSRPRVVTQSNVKAEVKQGVKLPITTAATANANATTSYIDSVLRLSVTPQITADNTIFLTVDVENTQPEGTANSNGNFILTTQQTTTQVLVTDGGTVVIGGVIQTSNSVSTTQTPFLGNIPWLGNLFKERLVKTETDELIFFITPKIVQT
jgi:type IV pilus assembly protein PilQ